MSERPYVLPHIESELPIFRHIFRLFQLLKIEFFENVRPKLKILAERTLISRNCRNIKPNSYISAMARGMRASPDLTRPSYTMAGIRFEL